MSASARPKVSLPSSLRWLRPVLGIGLALLVLELVIRQIWVHQRTDVPGYVKIGTPGTASVWRLEGSGVTHRDAQGFRVGYGQDGPKVLVLGDSFTEALEVDDDQVFTYLAEQSLRREGLPIALINHGVAGRSVADYVAFAARHRAMVGQDWTVVVLRDDDLAEDTVRPGKTRFIEGTDGSLDVVIDEERSAGRLREMIWHSPSIFLRYTFYKLSKYAEEYAKEPPLFLAASYEHQAPAAVDYASYPVEAAVEALAAAYAGRLTIVSLPYVSYGPPRLEDSEVRQRLKATCQRLHLSCIEPEAEFLELATAYESPFGFANSRFNYGHMNPAGHRAVAEALARELGRLKRDAVF